MKRLLLVALFLALLIGGVLATVSCGNVFVRGAINTGSQSATGTVSIVQFSSDSGGVSITIITLSSSGMANTLNFCGDQRLLFPANQRVQVSFMPGTPCDSVLSVHLM
jgi:hypothetical protein